MTTTENLIETHRIEFVKELFNNDALYYYCMVERRDESKIDKLLTINRLDDFWDKVRNFTKNVYSDHAIHRWQCLAELREIQLDLQQNYYYDNNKNEILKKGA